MRLLSSIPCLIASKDCFNESISITDSLDCFAISTVCLEAVFAFSLSKSEVVFDNACKDLL